NGGATLINNTSSGSDLANLQGYGQVFHTGDGGNVITGPALTSAGLGGGNIAQVTVGSQGVAQPTLSPVTAATTAATPDSTGNGALESALDAAFASGTVAHLSASSYNVNAPIVINLTSSSQGPIGFDLGGAKLFSHINGGGP